MEGFGLPALEAAACGCPVIATKASPLQGLLGDASVHIQPVEHEISRALEEVLSSAELRARMSEGGLNAARRLTWDQAARQMMDVIGTGAQR
jgi:glycosyltransferase involved in cell wall biosynthesis